jgi:protein translocase SecG subunit
MSAIINAFQAVLAVLIIVGVLLQQRAAGFASGVVGGTNVVQRRGAEKLLYQGTIVLAIAFLVLSVLEWFA